MAEDLEQVEHELFLELLHTAAHPSSADAISADDLAASLAIDKPMTREQALETLERDILAPLDKFEGSALGRWQVQPHIKLPAPPLTLTPLYATHTITPSYLGIDGKFTHWREALAPKPPAHPALSSSTSRAPGSIQNFVRGKGSYAPFLPGGLEISAKAEEPEEDDFEEEEGWKTRAPGLPRGLKLSGADEFLAEMLGQQSLATKAKRRRRDDQFSPQLAISRLGDKDVDVDGLDLTTNGKSSDKNIDDLLPIGRLPAPPPSKKAFKPIEKKDWAHVVDVNQKLLNFNELVPDMAREYPFELDNFQKEAIYHLETGDSVFVAAHTSAGKTVVAEYAIALAAKHMTKAIYTSPIKALSNQKFRDFKTTFDPATVGILTGDVQINAEGSCLIMTTEILRSMLYKGADLIRDVEFVIFDEVHYVNDAERGVVWEEVIIMLPEHVNIILLSATVPNTREFADWVGRTKKKDIYVISTPFRPVPLEHFLYAGRELHRIVDSKSNFLGAGYAAAGQSLVRKQDKEREAAGLPPVQKTGGRGGAMRGRGGQPLPNGRGAPFTRVGGGRAHSNRGGGQGAPQFGASGGVPRGGGGGGGAGGRGRGGFSRPTHILDQNIWTHLISHLKKNTLLPVVNFVFSKKRCEEYASNLSLDLNSAKERSEVHIVWERALTRLKGDDKTLPQIIRMRELLSRGIGVHHGGLLPLVKEVVEILFARGLVKVLFATETFAMGVNMPAKCVVFSGIRKHDGTSFRNLLPGEYTQMAGRAGRRGLDTTGTVIILSGDELPSDQELRDMMLGVPGRLSSQFRLTYNMILNLLRVEALKVEEMIKRSFSENATQKMAPEQQRLIAHTEKELAKLPNLTCATCSPDIGPFYDLSLEAVRINAQLLYRAAWSPHAGRLLLTGRVVILRNSHYPGNLAIILNNAPPLETDVAHKKAKAFRVLVLVTPGQKEGSDDLNPSEVVPRWPPVLPKGKFPNPTFEIDVVNSYTISFVLDKIIKCNSLSASYRKLSPEVLKTVETLSDLHEDLSQQQQLPEVDWSRLLKDLDLQELSHKRKVLTERVSKLGCVLCEDFADHYAIIHERKLVEKSLQSLKVSLSDQNLELLPDYNSRVEVLKRLSFIDENSTVLLKGRVACEINSAPELILTELILENILADYNPEEVVALLSVFVFVEKTDSQPIIPSKLQDGLDIIYRIAQDVEREQDACQVQHDDFATKYKTGLVEVVYEWAKGLPFNKITELTDVPEGTIVRCITRLDETCREVRDAARVIGDADLFQKMEAAQGLIKRDIVFAASLYL